MPLPAVTPEESVAGVSVRHEGPFSNLHVIEYTNSLSRELTANWVTPYYFLNFHSFSVEQTEAFAIALKGLSQETIESLLCEKNWRSRVVGANMVALLGLHKFEDRLGNLLLRSDLCFVGRAYCFALAVLNSSQSVKFLNQYLNYYLCRHELWFDQGEAMGAVAHLDEINGTNHLQGHMGAWNAFVANKPYWSLARSIKTTKEIIVGMRNCAARVKSN